MAEDILKGNWQKLRGEIKKQWGKLTDDDLTKIKGYKDKLFGLIQEKYGFAKQEIENQYEKFMEKMGLHEELNETEEDQEEEDLEEKKHAHTTHSDNHSHEPDEYSIKEPEPEEPTLIAGYFEC